MDIDYQSRLWVAYEFGLIVLNKDFEEIQIFALENEYRFNEINKPGQHCSILIMNDAKTFVYWLKDNDQIIKINIRNFEFVEVFEDVTTLGKKNDLTYFLS